MTSWFTAGELVVLISAICLLAGLPLLAAGAPALWFGAQGLYFIGIALIIWRYLSPHARN